MDADGMNRKAIAAELNRRKAPSPGADWNRQDKRGDGKWMGSAVYSMLDDEIYAGQIVWNRGTWELDPETDRRVCKMLPEPRNELLVRTARLREVRPQLHQGLAVPVRLRLLRERWRACLRERSARPRECLGPEDPSDDQERPTDPGSDQAHGASDARVLRALERELSNVAD